MQRSVWLDTQLQLTTLPDQSSRGSEENMDQTDVFTSNKSQTRTKNDWIRQYSHVRHLLVKNKTTFAGCVYDVTVTFVTSLRHDCDVTETGRFRNWS